MSDLRRLIARMDQLNEADPRNSRGLDMPPLEGGSTGAGGAGGAAPSVRSGPLGTTIYTSPPPRVTPAGSTPTLPANIEAPAFLRSTKPTSQSMAQRQQKAADINAKLDTLPKPKVDIKDVQAQAAQQRALQRQLKDPRPAVWKNPSNPSAPASKSPPPANVEPPAPLKTPTKTTSSTSTAEPSADQFDVSVPDLYAPTPTQPTSTFNRPTSARPQTSAAEEQPPEWFQNWNAEQQAQRAQQAAKDAEADKPGFLRRNWGKLATGATLAGEYGREKAQDWASAKERGADVPPFWSTKTFDPTVDLNKLPAQTTKESLHDKLFKEFKTFVEKR